MEAPTNQTAQTSEPTSWPSLRACCLSTGRRLALQRRTSESRKQLWKGCYAALTTCNCSSPVPTCSHLSTMPHYYNWGLTSSSVALPDTRRTRLCPFSVQSQIRESSIRPCRLHQERATANRAGTLLHQLTQRSRGHSNSWSRPWHRSGRGRTARDSTEHRGAAARPHAGALPSQPMPLDPRDTKLPQPGKAAASGVAPAAQTWTPRRPQRTCTSHAPVLPQRVQAHFAGGTTNPHFPPESRSHCPVPAVPSAPHKALSVHRTGASFTLWLTWPGSQLDLVLLMTSVSLPLTQVPTRHEPYLEHWPQLSKMEGDRQMLLHCLSLGAPVLPTMDALHAAS